MAISSHAAAHHDASLGAKERLIDSAVTLFSERGYSATSIREIIEEAGVTRPVLYYYFKNKEDLFCHLIEAEFDAVCSELDAIVGASGPWRERLKQVIERAFRRARRSPAMVRLLMQFFFSPPIPGIHLDKEQLGMERFSRIAALMEQGIAAGEVREAGAEELALAFSGLVDMHVMATFDDPNAAYTDEVAERLIHFFLHGAAEGAD